VLTVIDVTAASGAVARPDLLSRAEPIHRELRPNIETDYVGKMQRIFAQGGRMAVALDDEEIVGVAVWRSYENTFDSAKFYCDDLVTTQLRRASGVGKALIDHMIAHAIEIGAKSLTLSSGTQRTEAHRFYFRNGFVIPAFAFARKLT
jgi:GNAT superfamily N-acetyltransferase